MKRRMALIVFLLLVVLGMEQGARAAPQPPAVDLVEVHVTAADAGKRVTLGSDELLRVALEANPSTGYRWEVVDTGTGLLKLVEAYDFAQSAPVDGQPIRQILRFLPLQAGTETLRLVYRRPWETAQPPLRKFALTVKATGATTAELPLTLETQVPETRYVPLQEDRELTSLPSSLNWCDYGYCTDVKNQGACGSCWAFSTVGTLESALRIWDETTRDLSEQYLVSCNMNGWGCDGGFYAHDYHADTSLPGELPGPVYETDFPYEAAEVACSIPYTHHERLESWAYGTNEVTAIKDLLYKYGPVSASVCVGPDFQTYTGGIFATDESGYCSGSGSNHGIILTGWDDADQVWILRNSWGPTWGESGYMRIRWDTSNVGIHVNHIAYGVPRDLTVSALSASELQLHWTDVTGAEQGFKIERAPAGTTDWSEVGTVGVNVTHYADSGLSCNTAYDYRVRAYKDTFNTAYTATAGATTVGCSGSPDAPSNLGVTSAAEDQLDLSWTDNSMDELGFRIERSASGTTGWSEITTLGANAISYQDSGLRCNTPYYYRVRAYNGVGDSATTDVVLGTTGTCSSCPDAYEADDSPATATAIATDGGTQTHTFHQEGDEDWVSFSAQATYTYTLSASGWSAPNDPYLYLYDASGEDVVARGSQIVWTAVQTGTYYVRALHRDQEGGCSGYTYTLSVLEGLAPEQPPAAPSNLTATATGLDRNRITWTDNSDNEDGFKIEHSWDSVNWGELATMGANVTGVTITGYGCGTTAYYRVRATNVAGDSDYSNAAWAITYPCEGAPEAPTALNITPVSGSQLDLSWTDNSVDETGFTVERSPDGANHWTSLTTTAADVTAYADSGLTCGTTYYYRIQARNANGGSNYALGSGATQACGTPPAAPSDLSAAAISGTQIELGWTDNSSDETGFKIERSPSGSGTWAQIDLLGTDVTIYQDAGLACGTAYDYRVRATQGGNDSAYSNTATATTPACPPAVPSDLTATGINTSTIDLSWTDNSDNEDGFKVDYSYDSVNWGTIPLAWPDATGVRLSGFSCGTTVYFQVRAYNAEGDSSTSNTAWATTHPCGGAPDAPTALNVTTVSTTQLDLSWTDNSDDETGFNVERSLDGATNWTLLTTTAAGATTYSDTELTCETTYYYRVQAANAYGESDYATGSSTTTACLPAAPSDLSGMAISGSQINLSWTDNSDNETGFHVERSPSGSGAWTQVIEAGADVTTYQDTGLMCGTAYDYRVQATNAGGDSAYSDIASVSTTVCPPATPSDLDATAASGSRIDLSWTDNSSDETGFEIERSPSGDGTWAQIAAVDADVTTYQDTGLTCGTAYDYRVRATNAGGDSAYSDVATATTTVCLPDAPSDLSATAASGVRIDLSWTDNSSDETGFEIERSPSGDGTWAQIAAVDADVTTYQDTGLTCGTAYDYRVRATNAGGDSAYSDVAAATTRACASAPAAPSDLSATSVSGSQIDLSWTDNSSDETRFEIERSSGGSSTWVQVGTVDANVTTYQDTGLACGTSYDYRVRAANTVGESAFSSMDSATTTVCPPDAPSGLSATAASGSQINLSWTDNSSDETGFEIERSLSGNGTWTQIATVDADVTTYQDTGLACGTAYDYRGRATNAGGDSAYSATASATTAACPGAPAAPTGLQAGEVTTQAVTLRWTDNSLDETGFTVQRSSGAMEDWADLGTTAADVTAYQDVTVACGTTYTYRVQAYNAIGDSAFSNVLEVSTGDCPSGKYRVYLPSVLRAPGVNAVSEAAGGLASAESSRDVGGSAVRSDVFDLRMVSWTRTAVADARWAVCSLAP